MLAQLVSPLRGSSLVVALALASVAGPAEAQETAPQRPPTGRPSPEASDASDPRYPDYVTAGSVLLPVGAGIGLAGLAVGAAADDGKAALGLGALGTTSMAVGLPLLLLGLTPDAPADSANAYAGIALATPGVISFGLGGSIMMFREFGPNVDASGAPQGTPDRVLPIVLMAGGAAATVGGIILWASGAEADDGSDAETAVELSVSPGYTSVRGTF